MDKKNVTLGIKENRLATNVKGMECFHITFERGRMYVFTRYFKDWEAALNESLRCAEVHGVTLHKLVNEY